MELTAIQSLMTSTLSDFGNEVLIVLTAVIGVAIAYFLFKFAWSQIITSTGTTSNLGKRWAWFDRMTYKPYKGYNRLRSRKWNMEHTMQ